MEELDYISTLKDLVVVREAEDVRADSKIRSYKEFLRKLRKAGEITGYREI